MKRIMTAVFLASLALFPICSASLLDSTLEINPRRSWGPGMLLEAAEDSRNTSNPAPHSRIRRQLIDFPDDAILGFYFKLVVPYWSYPRVSTKGDYRFEVTFELPNSLPGFARRKRSLANERAVLYEIVEDFFVKAGLDGTSCVLRAVCEVAENPLDEYGLLGEFMTLIFSAGYGSNGATSEHLEAEEYGRSFGACWTAYPECPMSLREVLYEFFINNGQIPDTTV